jgi:hypothetical protein
MNTNNNNEQEQQYLCFATPQQNSFRISVGDQKLMSQLIQTLTDGMTAQVYDSVHGQWVTIPLELTTTTVVQQQQLPQQLAQQHLTTSSSSSSRKRKFASISSSCCENTKCTKRHKPHTHCDENYCWRKMHTDLKLYIFSFVYSCIVLKPKQVQFTLNGYEFVKTWYVSKKKFDYLERALINNLYGRLDGEVYPLFLPKIATDSDILDIESSFFSEEDSEVVEKTLKYLRSAIPWYKCSKLKVPLTDLLQIGIERLSRQQYPTNIKLSCTHDDIIPAVSNNSIIDKLNNRSLVYSGFLRRIDMSVSAGYINNDQFGRTITKLSELGQFNKCEIRAGFGCVFTIDGAIRTDASDIDFSVLRLLTNCKTLKLHYSEIDVQLTERNMVDILSAPTLSHVTIKMLNDDQEVPRFGFQSVAGLATHPGLRKLNIQCGSALGAVFLDPISKNSKLTSLKLRFKVTPDDLVKILNGGRFSLKRLKIGGNSGVHLGNQLVDSLIQTQNQTLKSLYIRGSSADTDSVMKFIKHCTSVTKLVYFEKVGLELVKRTFDRRGNTSSGILNGCHEINVN